MNYLNKNIEDSFDKFLLASNLKEILSAFNQLCDLVDLNPSENSSTFYQTLQNKLKSYWKAQALFAKLEKKVSQKEYRKQVFTNIKVLVIGSGPCGIRTAIELALLGARVVVIEKRESFSRNNVLHLWPFVIEDLKSLGAKIFFGMFCAGSIDHISIKRLQCILLKVALLFGVQIFIGVTFHSLIEPDCKKNIQISAEGDNEDRFGMKKKFGWRAKISPHDHIISDYQFNTVVGADGKGNILGFRRKELRCRLAIAITANFINKNTFEEAQVEEISGVAFIFNQQFFKDIYDKTGIDLENIVYYKDETHYFVMTAKKASLLAKGVLKKDLDDPDLLLNNENIDYISLQKYAEEAANVVTNNKIPNLEFSKNHRGEADVAVFDFTHLFAAESASKIIERNGYLLLQILVGDSLLEPFWPTGSGCALGFLSSLDASWLVRRMGLITNAFAQNKISSYEQKVLILEAIAERESVYQRLSQTTPNNMPPNFHTYTLNPRTRYTQCKMNCFDISQILHLYDTDDVSKKANILKCDFNNSFKTDSKSKLTQLASFNSKLMGINLSLNYDSPIIGTYINSNSMKREYMLRWFQIRLDRYFDFKQFKVDDLSKSWISGVAFLCLIHLYRPDLIDISSINNEDKLKNLKTAIALFENEFHVTETLNIFYSFENLDLIPIFKYLEKIYETLRVLNPVRSEIHVHRCIDNRKVKRRYIPKNIIGQEYQYQLYNLNSSKVLCKTDENRFVSNDIEKGIIEMRKNEILKLYNSNNKNPPFSRKRIISSLDTTDTPFTNHLNIKPKEIKNKLGDKSFLKIHERLKTTNSICHFCKNRIFCKNQETFENYSFHKYCFRCEYCNKELSNQQFRLLQNNHDSEGKFYCMRHFEKISNICFIRDKNVSNLRDLLMKEDKKNYKFPKIEKLKTLSEKIKKPKYCLNDYGCLLLKNQNHTLPVDQIFNDMVFLQEMDIDIILKKNYLCLRRINDESDEEYNGSLDESLLDFVEPLDENQFSWCLSFNKHDLKYALKKCQVIRKNRLIYKKYKSKEESTSDESEINMLVHDICKTSDDEILDYPTVSKDISNNESLNSQNDTLINKFQDVISPIYEFQDENSNIKEILSFKNVETFEINNDKYSVKDQNINIISDKNSIQISKITNIKDDSKALRQLAKLKFCTEPPKPVSINPKEFISEINRKKTVSCYISCHLQVAEILPSTENIFLIISNRFSELCNFKVHKKSILSASVLSINTYGFNFKLKDELNDRINNLKNTISMPFECFEDKAVHRNKMNSPQNILCDIWEIKDIDSLSVNTEDSSITHTEIISENDILSNVVPLKLKMNQKATLDSELDISLGVSSINEIPFDNKCSNNSLDSIESSSLNSSMKSDISASSESDGKISPTDNFICDNILNPKIEGFINCKNSQKNTYNFEKKKRNNKSNLLKDQKSLISFSLKTEANLKELPITLKSFSDTVTPPHDIELDDTQVKCMELNSQFSFILENSMSLKNSDISSNFQRVDCINKQLENIEDRLNEFNHKNFHDISFVTDLSDEKSKIDQLYQNSKTFSKENTEEIDKRIIMDLML